MPPRAPAASGSRLGARAAFAAGALAVWLLLPACGKKGSPLPPLRLLPEMVKGLRAHQVGDRITVALQRPVHRTDGSPLGEDAELEILLSAREPVPRTAREVS